MARLWVADSQDGTQPHDQTDSLLAENAHLQQEVRRLKATLAGLELSRRQLRKRLEELEGEIAELSESPRL